MRKIRVLFAAVLSSCYEPSPLYGTWADNLGDSITFIDGGGFVARIKTNDETITYQGDYTVIDNIISFSYMVENEFRTITSEWDIRGSIMYLDWPIDGEPQRLTLYHTSK